MKNLFSPKTCKYNINSTNDIFKALDEVCDKEKTYTDDELSNELADIYDFCCGGVDGKSFYSITHNRSTKLVKQRVKKYCKKNKIKLEEYDEVLPYRKFYIDLIPDLRRKEKLEKIICKVKNEDHEHIKSLDEQWWEFHKKRRKKNGKTYTK